MLLSKMSVSSSPEPSTVYVHMLQGNSVADKVTVANQLTLISLGFSGEPRVIRRTLKNGMEEGGGGGNSVRGQ